MSRLDGKVAIITGAAQGIGLGIARVFAEAGATTILSDINAAQGEAAVRGMEPQGGSVLFVSADVTQENEVRALVGKAIDTFGRLDIVVNNAGICTVKSAEQSTVEEWDEVMAVNVRSIFLTTKFAVPPMRKNGGGSLLNVASVSSFVGQQNTPAYCASKGAVLMLTKSLALDYGPDNIRVNCICPGITDTPMLRSHVRHAPDPDAHLQQRLRRVPMGQMLYPDDMGRAAAFLCSDDAKGITGASLVVDGGYISCAEFFPAG
ncbi:MAG: SDR family oxidoreductase [Armatimonadetes bacterium]|nr:SDR family oxidoreductase [Armatimonadota bacterium]